MSKKKNIYLFNTKTKNNILLSPISDKNVLVYSCGPTLYMQAHIGNMRAYVFADTLNRALRTLNYNPKHVINFTDVGHLTDDSDAGEDKVELQALKENLTALEITEKFAKLFLKDLEKLNIDKRRYVFPRATEYISEQIDLIKELEKKGFTYSTSDGIYFDTQKCKGYGALGLPPNDKEDEDYGRINKNEEKKNNNDFALWKKSKTDEKRLQEWDSPWGRGFPGWHIECSAMAMKLLAKKIDIHTGGIDHIPVHHNNEIAQSESATGKTFSNIWMHVAFLTSKEEKLSKSKNNSFTIDELEKLGYTPLALRYLFMQSNYSTPLSFSFESLMSAQKALNNLNEEYEKLSKNIFSFLYMKKSLSHVKKIDEAIADNLNTAKVLAIVWEIVSEKKMSDAMKKNTIKYADSFLGVLFKREEEEIPKHIIKLAEQREVARKNKDYIKSDELRDLIIKEGYSINDEQNGKYRIQRFG